MKHEKQSVIMLKYLIKHNSLEKKLQEHNIYDKEIDFICQLILGVKKDEQMLRENKFCLYQIVNNSVNGVDVDKWDYLARDTHYLGMNSAFDFNRILPFVKVLDVKRGSKTRRELCFRDKVASDLNHMFLTGRRLHHTSYQHRVSKIITIMLKEAFHEAADHLLFVGEGGKEYNLFESVKDPKAFCQVNDTIVSEIMRSRSQEPGMVKAREIIDRIHKRELYQCIVECQHANEEMRTVDPAEIKRLIVTDVGELSSPSSPSSSEIWQAQNIEVEVSHFDYGSGDRNPLLDIPFYKKSNDGKSDAELLTQDKLPADLPHRLLDVTFRIYTKVPKLDRQTINMAGSRCKTRLENFFGRRRYVPPIGPRAPSPPINVVSPLTSSSSGSGIKNLPAGSVSAFRRLVFNDPIHSSVQMPKHCQIIIDTPEFQRLRFIKQLGCTYYVFPSAVHTRFEHSIGVSHLGGKLASMLQQNDRDSSTPILDTEVACVEIACLCRNLGHVPFSHAFEDIVPPDKDGKKWKHEKQSVIMLKYLIKHNSLEKKLQEHNIYDKEIDFICQLILGVKKDEQMLRENKFCLYQIVNNSVNGVDVDRWDCIARDTHYLGMNSAFDFNRILPFVKVLDVKRGCKARRELCFRDKVASDLNQMFGTRRRLQSTSYQHRVSKIITIMLKDAFQEAADHLIFVGEGGKKYNLLESVKDPEAFCQVNDTIVNAIMRSLSQEPGMVKAREIIGRIHKRELYQCIAERQHANEEMRTVDPAEIKRLIVTDVDELSSPSSSSSSEIWQAHNIEVEVSRFVYGSGGRNPLLDIPFYKKSNDGKFYAELLPNDKLPADLPHRLQDVTFRVYTKVPKLDRETIKKARSRCKTKLEMIHGRQRSVPTTPVKHQVTRAVSPLTSPSSVSGPFVSTDWDAGTPSLMSAKVTLNSSKRQITF